MIAYRFQNLRDHPQHGVLVQDNEPRPAMFLLPEKAKVVPFERLTIAKIQATVSAYYGLAPEHMCSPSRDRGHVYPRQLAMLLVRELLPMHGLTEIGRRFGGRDHTTVMHGLKRVKERIDSEPATRRDYEALREKLA